MATPYPVLVIGYGNTLRGDDAVGYQIAETVAEWQIPQVRSLAVHQLLPELTDAIATANTIIFVDAAVTAEPDSLEVQWTPLPAAAETSLRTHTMTPQFLLALTQRLHGVKPTAYLLTIPGVDFRFGSQLSVIAQIGKDSALTFLRDSGLLKNVLQDYSSNHLNDLR